jgi:hypothetical protein
MQLGRLEEVPLRSYWKNEALDFTRWLSLPENLAQLSEEIDMEIHLILAEAPTGKFNTDILGEDDDGNKIIIENQLEATNHDHLGKIITYASGHDAKTIIWIVEDVEDEHKRAIEWLNEHTDDDINLFIIRMELWQIGDSLPAPKFHIIAQPNDWAKAMKKSADTAEPTKTKLMQLEFWQKFIEFAKNNKTALRLRNPRAQHWYDIAIGSSFTHLSLTINTQQNTLGCGLYIMHEKALFNELVKKKEQIEKDIGEQLEWMPLAEKKASRIKISKEVDIENVHEWENYFAWLKEKGELFQRVFQKYLREARAVDLPIPNQNKN